jgi:hypothetical protein
MRRGFGHRAEEVLDESDGADTVGDTVVQPQDDARGLRGRTG